MLLHNDAPKMIIVNSLQWLSANERAYTHGFVLIPNHIHILWSPGEAYKISKAEHDLLSFTGHEFKNYLSLDAPHLLNDFISTQADRSYHFWERRPRSIEIMSRSIAEQKLSYIHDNPVKEKWQLSKTPEEYKFSSASFYHLSENKYPFLRHYMDFC